MFFIFYYCCFCLFVFNWSIIAFWCFVSFCCTMKWMGYMYTYIRSLLSLLPPLPPVHEVITGHGAELLVIDSSLPPAVCFTRSDCVSVLLSIFVSPSPLHSPTRHPYPQVPSLCLCLYSCPENRFISAIFSSDLNAFLYTISFNLYSSLVIRCYQVAVKIWIKRTLPHNIAHLA